MICIILDVNECHSNPCLNGGKCIDEVDKHSCECLPGYKGEKCEIGKADITLCNLC